MEITNMPKFVTKEDNNILITPKEADIGIYAFKITLTDDNIV